MVILCLAGEGYHY